MRKVQFILPFIVLLGLIISLEDTYTALSLSAAVIFHELGHILMIKLLGGTLVKSELYGVGANINYYLKKRTNAKEILISSAGPLFGFICANIGNYFSFELFYNFSISLCLINLLPVLPLDGGNIIRSILYFDKHDIFIHTISIPLFETTLLNGEIHYSFLHY